MSWCVSPWVHPVWDSLCLLDLINYFLSHVGEIFNYNLFKNFLIPFLFFFSCISWLCSPFNICCKADLVVLNSLNFCLSEKLFISSSILNEILASYNNLGCRFFPFSTLNISCHSLLACSISDERSAVKHMGFPLYVTCCFSIAAFNILSFCLVC